MSEHFANTDWRPFFGLKRKPDVAASPRGRLLVMWLLFVGFLLVILARMVFLEFRHGEAYRRIASEPIYRQQPLLPRRGEIVDRNGQALATDAPVTILTIHYRYLQQPLDEVWLRGAARRLLDPTDRRDATLISEKTEELRSTIEKAHHRLARLCGESEPRWSARRRRIQARVERIAQSTNTQRKIRQAETNLSDWSEADSESKKPWTRRLLDTLRSFNEPVPPPPIVVKEQTIDHIMFLSPPAEAIAEIKANQKQFPGVKLGEKIFRTYSIGAKAAHVVGYVTSRSGRTGVERSSESLLAGSTGRTVETLNHRGKTVMKETERSAINGKDVVMTMDARLQAAACRLLNAAIVRGRLASGDNGQTKAGGAVVIMDVHSGAILAAVSAPQFDPNDFALGKSDAVEKSLSDPARPMFDRVGAMALPPGSIFKVVTAAALLENQTVSPEDTFFCQGYLLAPNAWRCLVYRRRGIGHGNLTLADALTESCNVFFFHHATRLGQPALLRWADKFGFGRTAGQAYPSQSPGKLPSPSQLPVTKSESQIADETRALAVGQSTLTATPLQVARMMATIANGGFLVDPYLIERGEDHTAKSSQKIKGLHPRTIQTIQAALRRVVNDPEGTGYQTVRHELIPIAGKSGTAQVGANLPDHAWFAGYAPADQPRYALVVVVEHGGSGARTAGPVVRELVDKMRKLGYFADFSVARKDKKRQGNKQ